MDYRHELKFIVSDMELKIIEYRLKPLMHMDIHQNGDSYAIRSLYFDDRYNSCLKENESGLNNRSKYRIRIYNANSQLIKLEKKQKCNSMTRKRVSTISSADCLTYMAGKTAPLCTQASDLQKEFYAVVKGNGYIPVTIVEYIRTAFTDSRGNVRITFDRNISSTDKISSFLDSRIDSVPLLPKGIHILEVKYDEFLPEYIADVLTLGTLQQSAFSKYAYSRNYNQY